MVYCSGIQTVAHNLGAPRAFSGFPVHISLMIKLVYLITVILISLLCHHSGAQSVLGFFVCASPIIKRFIFINMHKYLF